jgi:tellurite methyltransferase
VPSIARSIIGFSLDAEGDWVAELSCGHRQHIRHKPPWQVRPWLLSEEGRREHLGATLVCVNCGMPALPAEVQRYKSTPEFDETSIPAGLLRRHTLKPGVWGRIVVREGRLLYVIERNPVESFVLRPEVPGIVAPEEPHHVEAREHVRFFVEFFAHRGDQPKLA